MSMIITEIESVINTRPLTYLYDDDEVTAITPSHLIIGRNLRENINKFSEGDFDMTKDECTRRYKYLKTTIEHFWNRFSQEYMNNLREHHSYNRRKYDSFNKLEVNAVVIIKDDEHLPGLPWKKGVVQELISGRDNKVRGAVVRVIDNRGKPITLKRDIKRLRPLELAKNIIDNDTKCMAVVNADIIRKLNV